MPQVYNKRLKNYPIEAVYIGRPSIWGNPFVVEVFGRELAVALYDNMIHGVWNPVLFDLKTLTGQALCAQAYILCHEWLSKFIKRFGTRHPTEIIPLVFKDKDVLCWCVPLLCHGASIIKMANVIEK